MFETIADIERTLRVNKWIKSVDYNFDILPIEEPKNYKWKIEYHLFKTNFLEWFVNVDENKRQNYIKKYGNADIVRGCLRKFGKDEDED